MHIPIKSLMLGFVLVTVGAALQAMDKDAEIRNTIAQLREQHSAGVQPLLAAQTPAQRHKLGVAQVQLACKIEAEKDKLKKLKDPDNFHQWQRLWAQHTLVAAQLQHENLTPKERLELSSSQFKTMTQIEEIRPILNSIIE